ncbi:MAG TPA: ATP-dependent endonuclease [Brevibacterium sp.]|uniref:AAA domain-containing protein n=1 Tax=Brevibacterium antiquum CNRZ 918 TaxID=1255637 RepID=A0A2H1KTY0_9MICO|nr:TOPRIM nucleotidyl transferase/hydrolase domain-containing protein [Brevibacterium antiquum]SMY03131.1 AAA domain-containing protein [Brevibacterium antiquum CNRZ 918]HCG54895.1 ATP-dependent endonuclease [Brevibacterium sp.]
MHVESLRLRNFRCFGDVPVPMTLESGLTALIGTNGTGKTAAFLALQRMFGISSEERTIRLDDFHVPVTEVPGSEPSTRHLTIDVVLAFPELDEVDRDVTAVPDFFRRMVTDAEGHMKCRIVLDAIWSDDGTIDGSVETCLYGVSSLDDSYSEDRVHTLPAAERSRIQFVYVPASRDGARQVSGFLRGRLWKAAIWSEGLRDLVCNVAADVSSQFHQEAATKTVEDAFGKRWQQLQGAGTHSQPRFQPLEPDIDQFLRGAELTFEPDPSSPARPARLLSDGQRSLLHLALTTATLDLERTITTDPTSGFDPEAVYIPALTILAIEEPENSLSPYYLSRIIRQLHDLAATPQVQALLSSHSASALGRIDPRSVRHFRQHPATGESNVRPITLPEHDIAAATYVREAVRAHPELYFARFVVLGEGDSEHIVIPALARALGIELDPSFVAMVPLGGRHTNHFWRLLTDLQIPHATLLDLDFGRSDGGSGRYRTAISNLEANDIRVLDEVDDHDTVDDVTDDKSLATLKNVRDALRRYGVFFSAPLDLDMLMLRRYWSAYTALEGGQRGPDSTDATNVVLGTGGTARGRKYWSPEDKATKEDRQDSLRWYRYLFTNRSKPATHLAALTRMTDEEIKECIPEVLNALIEFVRSEITPK